MKEISTKLIEEAIYNLCFEANTCFNAQVYNKIYNSYKSSKGEIRRVLQDILKNSNIAFKKKLPLCQDTGQVIVFAQIGQNVHIKDGFIEDSINIAIEKCYKEKFFRKSIVKNALFDRINTNTNTPAIIYTKYTEGDEIKLSVLIKGAGSENKSQLKMMLPTSNQEEIVENCAKLILDAGSNSCPPMFIGIGIGGTAEKAMLMSKETFIEDNCSQEEAALAQKIQNLVNKKAPEIYENNYVLDVKVKTAPTHIACMPLGITINCHSDRTAKCVIKNNEIKYEKNIPEFQKIDSENETIKEVFADDTETIRNLKQGEKILLTGEIYIARDMAHKRMLEEGLPIDIKNKIIFYAGPCPNKEDEVIGSVGPTTAGRMDKYANELYRRGLLATIGKGERSEETKQAIQSNNGKYFTVTGGIAALLAEKVKICEVIAYEDLGTEALYKLFVEKFPIKTVI